MELTSSFLHPVPLELTHRTRPGTGPTRRRRRAQSIIGSWANEGGPIDGGSSLRTLEGRRGRREDGELDFQTSFARAPGSLPFALARCFPPYKTKIFEAMMYMSLYKKTRRNKEIRRSR